jgi:hypothetical protein
MVEAAPVAAAPPVVVEAAPVVVEAPVVVAKAVEAPVATPEEDNDDTIDIPSPFATTAAMATPSLDAEATQPINIIELRAALMTEVTDAVAAATAATPEAPVVAQAVAPAATPAADEAPKA